MDTAQAAPLCLGLASDPGHLVTLREAERSLEEVQMGLAPYLQANPLACPHKSAELQPLTFDSLEQHVLDEHK